MLDSSTIDFVIKYWYYFLGLVFVIYLLLVGPISQLIFGIKALSPSQAIVLLNRQSGLMLDVSDPKEFSSGHVSKSLNIPTGVLSARLNELGKHKGKPIVVICRTGNRSLKGAMILRKGGFDPVYTLGGGLLSWEKENLPLEK